MLCAPHHVYSALYCIIQRLHQNLCRSPRGTRREHRQMPAVPRRRADRQDRPTEPLPASAMPLNKGRGNDPQCAQVSGSRKAVLTVLGAVYGGVDHPLLGSDVMEVFFLMLAVIAGVGVAVFLFVIEPRRKIYDYDPHDPRQ